MIPRHAFHALTIGLALIHTGCKVDWVREHPLGCRAGEHALVRDTLYFGLAIPGGGTVAPAQWTQFENEVLLTAFPRGFSVLDSHGPWRGADGRNEVEASHLVVILHADDLATAASLRDVVARYKKMYRQEAVIRERAAVCVAF